MLDARPPQLPPAVLMQLLASRAGQPFHNPAQANQSWLLPFRGSLGSPSGGRYGMGPEGPGLAANQGYKAPPGSFFFGGGGFTRPAGGGHSVGIPGTGGGISLTPPSSGGVGGTVSRPPTATNPTVVSILDRLRNRSSLLPSSPQGGILPRR